MAAFVELVAQLTAVDATTWSSALPETSVPPEDGNTVVSQMLADIPLPTGFDATDLATRTTSGRVRDRYRLGADVTSAVACAWVRQWVEAKTAGDEAAAQAAIDAMNTSFEWDTMLELQDQDGLLDLGVWQYAIAIAIAIAIAGDGTTDGGMPDMPVADTYANALGCDWAVPEDAGPQ